MPSKKRSAGSAEVMGYGTQELGLNLSCILLQALIHAPFPPGGSPCPHLWRSAGRRPGHASCRSRLPHHRLSAESPSGSLLCRTNSPSGTQPHPASVSAM
ncbi:hypothetical protein E2C01_085100 [Portunus trituberculatus]|uniref:Uncharacterized protein n=1 Tax=Portunus trituberculatus TaxID=210409 RepID=A0A5B7J5V7_PORTR|nr:hypothetical protein [Portunus trituberculatus]